MQIDQCKVLKIDSPSSGLSLSLREEIFLKLRIYLSRPSGFFCCCCCFNENQTYEVKADLLSVTCHFPLLRPGDLLKAYFKYQVASQAVGVSYKVTF